jgi:sterol desaturase/sphingolipid hydroxylase (fatty acid hydroxylase superfamily)
MHHADLDIDVTTGLRFHPFEILISIAIKIAVVMAFGIPPVAVIVFEVVLNATSQFNHSNVRMPSWLDRILRLIVVTPDMHRVHHSVDRAETDSNFGFNLPWWDRLFEPTGRNPRGRAMTIGLPASRSRSAPGPDADTAVPRRQRRARLTRLCRRRGWLSQRLALVSLADAHRPRIGLGRRALRFQRFVARCRCSLASDPAVPFH